MTASSTVNSPTSSKVHFCDFRTRPGQNMLQKFASLLRHAGLEEMELNNRFTAVKLHFGEEGNLAYIRPNYVAVLVEMLKGQSARVYLTDCGTLYSGQRHNAVDHLRVAERNGFNPAAVGCNVIIADGLRGTDYREVPIAGQYCRTAKIGTAIADCDVLISCNHFKCHELTGFGGALKNIGMGSGSIGGKLEMHSSSKPHIHDESCTACGVCADNCLHSAISIDEELDTAVIDYERCVGCCQCVVMCQFNAARIRFDEAVEVTGRKMAEYTLAVLQGRPALHINFINNVSPQCDCWPHNDAAIVNDIGIAVSRDPVALDRACADMVNGAPHLPGSLLDDLRYQPGEDKFSRVHPSTSWKSVLDYAEVLGLGSQEYELVKI